MASHIYRSGNPGFAVYVHWPFCQSKCPYCDFNSHVRAQAVDEERFVQAFRAELSHRAKLTKGRTVSSIFFGGGTPSLMKPGTVAGILDAIAANWTVEPGAEVTLEANPTSVEANRFTGYRRAGVNRVSLGVQALNDPDLKALGRLHTAEEAVKAVAIAAAIFERYSFDLIYARPNQSPATWKAELTQALARAKDHMSLYQLTIEPDTMFERLRNAGKLKVPSPDECRILWDVTQEVMDRAGLPAYEISNHARPGGESRHNLIYWRYGEYVGVGPGAHGRIVTPKGRRAHATEPHPEMWLTCVETEGHGLVEDELLSTEEQGDEFLLMGLRLAEGIEPTQFEALSSRMLDRSRIASLLEEGMVEMTQHGRLRVSAAGFPLLDTVVADLAA
ncbi:Coproporphyrinogen III oxidase [Beijerinckiaceae bacterium RH CH11]|jgi:putative oxygen-independent coproporphyrinogen III oxidase|nr:radical SAM family heme chaperone HemW [Beijerinckiaceae bacterium]VVB49517.1 Coproporphyrinogen III oxidase [Beijerinckiaceae bacterium RH CH11]VVB49597.1 Coproporphyrinogen III oxidase [Beijerinckiaceae bacterium RH AL8]